MMDNATIDRDTMIRVNVPGTSGFYRLRCEAFFTVSKADFKKMMKVLQADTETAADNARIVSEWAFQNREAVKAAGSLERWAAINSIFSDYQERPESAAISSAVSDLEKLNKKLKTGRKVTKEIRGDDIYITNNSIVLKHGNAAAYENHETCVETSNTYERIFSGFENKAFLFSQVLPDSKTLKIQGKTRGAKQTAYYVNAKGTAFNVNYIQYAAAVTDSRDIYFNPDGNVCYMDGNGFTVAIAQCAIDFLDCANNIIITESRNTLAGMEVIYKYPCGDSLPVYRCIMEYFNGDHNTTYHPTKEAALKYAAETEKHYPGIIAGISINSGTIAGHMSWNEDGETFQAANIEAEAAEAKENNISSVPAGKEFSDHETDAVIISNASNASDASGLDLSRLNTLFLNAYEKLYQTRAYDYDAVKRFDEGLTDHEKEILNAFVSFRNDFISSDRECTAFIYAMDEIQKETAAADPEKVYKIAGVDLEKNRIEELINNNAYLVKARTVYRIERTRRGYIAINVYQKKTGVPIIGGACRFTIMNRERLEKMFPDFADKEFKPVPAADPGKLETMPESMPAVIPTKTAENGTEGNDNINTKGIGKPSVYQPKTGITEGIKKDTYSRQAENAIPAGIEKMSNCAKSTTYTIITNYHNMPTMHTIWNLDKLHKVHKPCDSVGTGFPSALSALEKIPFCDGKNAFCDIPSGVPPGPPGMRVSARWNHPSGIIQ